MPRTCNYRGRALVLDFTLASKSLYTNILFDKEGTEKEKPRTVRRTCQISRTSFLTQMLGKSLRCIRDFSCNAKDIYDGSRDENT